ncbi:MAG: response regulator [Pseudomonadota bacterium]
MKKKVMVIDDDAMNRRLFNVVLTSEGYDTVTTEGGTDAVDLALKEMPDLILLDMCMPDIDGLKVNEMMKQDQRLAGVPVIAVTALSGERHAAKAMDGGCAEYIRKPVSIPGFLQSVSRYLN